jgi:hypothetical protein
MNYALKGVVNLAKPAVKAVGSSINKAWHNPRPFNWMRETGRKMYPNATDPIRLTDPDATDVDEWVRLIDNPKVTHPRS